MRFLNPLHYGYKDLPSSLTSYGASLFSPSLLVTARSLTWNLAHADAIEESLRNWLKDLSPLHPRHAHLDQVLNKPPGSRSDGRSKGRAALADLLMPLKPGFRVDKSASLPSLLSSLSCRARLTSARFSHRCRRLRRQGQVEGDRRLGAAARVAAPRDLVRRSLAPPALNFCPSFHRSFPFQACSDVPPRPPICRTRRSLSSPQPDLLKSDFPRFLVSPSSRPSPGSSRGNDDGVVFDCELRESRRRAERKRHEPNVRSGLPPLFEGACCASSRRG